MYFPEKLFKVNGSKISTLVCTHDALLLSSQSFDTVEDFNKAWPKTLSLATKTEIKYRSIKSVTKEDQEDTLMIKYKAALNMPGECAFSFEDKTDAEIFYNFLEKEQYFTRIEQRLSPVKAALPYVIGLLFTIGITIFAHFQAIEIANGTVDESGSRKTRMFNNIIALIGDKGVWTIGGLVSVYILYTIWKRYTNPPNQTRFVPANA
jgi:hypothetical protein